MDNSITVAIHIVNTLRTYSVMVTIGGGEAMPMGTSQSKEFLMQVLYRLDITEDEIHNAMTNDRVIHREKIDQRSLDIVLGPYASKG